MNARGGLPGTSNMYALRLFIHELFPLTHGNSADCILKGFGNWNFLHRFFKCQGFHIFQFLNQFQGTKYLKFKYFTAYSASQDHLTASTRWLVFISSVFYLLKAHVCAYKNSPCLSDDNPRANPTSLLKQNGG